MSEHYDFHYQPTGSGAISGQQVLQQTEDAINELGDYVNDNVGGAMDVAQQALETAQNAEQDAQTALDTANSFSGAIQSAQQDASTALSTAQTAQTTASNANNTAIQAQQDASSAVTTANNASGQVSTLSGTVTALGQRVTTAEGNIGQNTSDITALTTRVGTAEGNITTLQNDVSIAQGNASSAMATAGTVKQQAYVLRYSSSSVTDNSTIAYSTLDNTDNIKSGDKVIDVDGKIFSVVSVDTTNQTVTVGTSLIDLALDGNVVHTSGNETINGVKSFNDKMNLLNAVRGIDITSQTINCNDLISNASGDIKLYRCISISGASNISNIPLQTAFILIVLQTKYTGINDTRAIQKFYDVGSSSQPISYTRALYNGTWSAWQLDDYALNSNVVHTSGNETVSGLKTLANNRVIVGRNTDTSSVIQLVNSDVVGDSASGASGLEVYGSSVSTDNKIGAVTIGEYSNNGGSYATIDCNRMVSGVKTTNTIRNLIRNDGSKEFSVDIDSDCTLGHPYFRWKGVYATNYYYGANNVEFSTKFVTTDTTQTITERKTFTKNVTIKNEDVTIGTTSGAGSKDLTFTDSADNALAKITGNKASNGSSSIDFRVYTTDNNNANINSQFSFFIAKSGAKVVNPIPDNDISLGRTSNRWKDTCTCLINGLEPSALSLPSDNINNVIDISSYLTILDGSNANTYTPSVNGWISITMNNSGGIQAFINGFWGNQIVRPTAGVLRFFMPICKNMTANILIFGGTIDSAKFIPCQGNV